MSSVVRKRKLSKDLKKSHVVQAAAAAFNEKGIKSVRMDDLAASLSVSKRTLYELFGDKEELLLEVVRIHGEEMRGYMRDVAAKAENVLEVILAFYTRTVDDFQGTNRAFFEDIKKYPKVVNYLEAGRKENIQSAIAFYKKGVEQGIIRDDVNFTIVQEMIHGQMDMLMRSEQTSSYSLVEIFETVVFMHMRGISTEKGLKIVNDFLNNLKQQKLKENITT